MTTKSLEPHDYSGLIEQLLDNITSTGSAHTRLASVLRTLADHILIVQGDESIAESMDLADPRRAGMNSWLELLATQVDMGAALLASLDESDRERRVRRLTTDDSAVAKLRRLTKDDEDGGQRGHTRS